MKLTRLVQLSICVFSVSNINGRSDLIWKSMCFTSHHLKLLVIVLWVVVTCGNLAIVVISYLHSEWHNSTLCCLVISLVRLLSEIMRFDELIMIPEIESVRAFYFVKLSVVHAACLTVSRLLQMKLWLLQLTGVKLQDRWKTAPHILIIALTYLASRQTNAVFVVVVGVYWRSLRCLRLVHLGSKQIYL